MDADVARAGRGLVSHMVSHMVSRMGSQRARAMLFLLVVCFALLSMAGATSRASDQVLSTAMNPAPIPGLGTITRPTPTPAAPPTATPDPLPPPPLDVPVGWAVYRDHHFSVAFPADWTIAEHNVEGPDGQVVAVAVTFNSADGSESVAIDEHEGLDAATARDYCAQTGSTLTYAGLPMRAARTSGTLRMFVFVAKPDPSGSTAGGVAYTLLYSEENITPQVKWLYDSILATFRPEFAAPACH